MDVACFVQSCLTDADFVLFSNYCLNCLIGTRPTAGVFFCVAAVAILGLIFLPAYSALVSALLFSVVTASMCAVNTMLVNLLPVKLGKNGGGTFYAGVTNSSAYFGGAASSLMIAAVLGFGGWREVNFLWCGIGIISAAVCFICAKPWARFFKADIVKKI
ncbi:MAG: hypothetical protein GXZ14_12165 [Ruminococcaceae bacterium]|nr:hypothetical protein [Oscillospiraceae bacterium]